MTRMQLVLVVILALTGVSALEILTLDFVDRGEPAGALSRLVLELGDR